MMPESLEMIRHLMENPNVEMCFNSPEMNNQV